MTDLFDLSQQVIDQATGVKRLNAEKHLRDRMVEVADALSGTTSELEHPIAFLEDCHSVGMAPKLPVVEEARGLLPLVGRLRGKAEEAPLDVLEDSDLAVVRNGVARVVQAVRAQGLTIWRDFCQANIPVPQQGLIELLEAREGGPTSALVRLESLDRHLAQLRQVDPTQSTGAPKLITESIAERNALWASFNLDQIPAEVRRFLSACATGGASLLSLSQDVRHWLEQQNLLDNYVVVPRTDL